MTLLPDVIEELRKRGLNDLLVFGGGIIPNDDIPKLTAAGVDAIFTPGVDTRAIIEYLDGRFAEDEAEALEPKSTG